MPRNAVLGHLDKRGLAVKPAGTLSLKQRFMTSWLNSKDLAAASVLGYGCVGQSGMETVGSARVPPAENTEEVMCPLRDKQCVPCAGGVPPLAGDELAQLFERLGSEWTLVEEHHLEKEFRFEDFREALAFTNEVGAVAEEQAHHPDIELSWGRVRVKIWTHKIDGLTESDFIFADKTDAVFDRMQTE